MMPMAVAVLAGGGLAERDTEGLSGALPMGIAFAASIGGLGTLVGSPTNAIAVGLLDTLTGTRITFAQWMVYGLPVVIIGVPLAAFLVARVQKVRDHPFDARAACTAIDSRSAWSSAEKRLVPVVAVTFLLWMGQMWIAPYLPEGSLTDGTIAILMGLTLFLLPDGTGRPLLVWEEADRAPWGVIMMFGGGLALAAGMSASGLADWLGEALLPLEAWPLVLVAIAVVGMCADYRVRQQCRNRFRYHPRRCGAGRGARRGPDPARHARRPRRQLGLHASGGDRPQRHRLGDRPDPDRSDGQGGHIARPVRHRDDRCGRVGDEHAGRWLIFLLGTPELCRRDDIFPTPDLPRC